MKLEEKIEEAIHEMKLERMGLSIKIKRLEERLEELKSNEKR